ncbi:O-fucosyltransferase family protein [Raphanus sativus]|nr:O-fucosyltransferase family protein [Raphanus sativus]
MNSPLSYKNLRLVSKSIAFKCLLLVGIALFYKALFLSSSPRIVLLTRARHTSHSYSTGGVGTDKFLEVPQIVWGLNNRRTMLRSLSVWLWSMRSRERQIKL